MRVVEGRYYTIYQDYILQLVTHEVTSIQKSDTKSTPYILIPLLQSGSWPFSRPISQIHLTTWKLASMDQAL